MACKLDIYARKVAYCGVHARHELRGIMNSDSQTIDQGLNSNS